MILSNEGGIAYLETQIVAYRNYIKKLVFLEEEYDKVGTRQQQVVVKTTSTGTNSGTENSNVRGESSARDNGSSNTNTTNTRNNVGFGAEAPFEKEITAVTGSTNSTNSSTNSSTTESTNSNNSSNTTILDDFAKTMELIEHWQMFFLQKCDRMVVGMVNTLKGVL